MFVAAMKTRRPISSGPHVVDLRAASGLEVAGAADIGDQDFNAFAFADPRLDAVAQVFR